MEVDTVRESFVGWLKPLYCAFWTSPPPAETPVTFCGRRADVVLYYHYWKRRPFDTVMSFKSKKGLPLLRLVDLASAGVVEKRTDDEDCVGPKWDLVDRVIERDTRHELSLDTEKDELISALEAIDCDGWVSLVSTSIGLKPALEVGLITCAMLDADETNTLSLALDLR